MSRNTAPNRIAVEIGAVMMVVFDLAERGRPPDNEDSAEQEDEHASGHSLRLTENPGECQLARVSGTTSFPKIKLATCLRASLIFS